MNRTDLIREIARATGSNYTVAEIALDTTLSTIAIAVLEGGVVRLRGFGTFRLRRTRSRSARNPRTGEAVQVPARSAMSFKPAAQYARPV